MDTKKRKIFILSIIIIVCCTNLSFAEFSEIQKQAADLNHDGEIDYEDLELIVDQDFPEKSLDGVARTDEDGPYIYQMSGTSSSDGTMVNAPTAESLTLFAKHSGGYQHFAITDIGTDDQIVWFGCNQVSANLLYFKVQIYKNVTTENVGKNTATITLKAGGHQCFSVWKNGSNYNVYTGSYATNTTYSETSNREYYYPKGINKLVLSSTTKSKEIDLSKSGVKISNEKSANIKAMGVDETTNRMVTVLGGTATVWNLEKTNFSTNSKSKVSTFDIEGKEPNQGGCLYGNYFYTVAGTSASDMEIICYDITTGQRAWKQSLNLENVLGGDWEPEGIEVYNYNGVNKIFVGFNMHGIYYFDY